MDREAVLSAFSVQREYFCDIDRQRILGMPVFRGYIDSIRLKAEEYRSSPPAELTFSLFRRFETDGNRSEYERVYFDRRGRLAAFGLLSWLYGTDEYIKPLEDILWSVLDEYTWCLPAHLSGKGLERSEEDSYTVDLFAAETAGAISEILYLNESRLSPIAVSRARRAVRERVLDRFLDTSFWWEHARNNWSAVCAGAVGIAALYEAETPERMLCIIEKLQPVIETYLSSFPADGVSLEGIGYWYYGFSFFTAYADMLKTASDGLLDWFSDPRAREIAHFQQKLFFDCSTTPRFSDCGYQGFERWWGLTSRLRREYGDVEFPPKERLGTFDCDHCYRWINILRDLVWADAASDHIAAPYQGYVLKHSQWLLCAGSGVYLAAKAGHNGESHNHNDIGSFELFKAGEELLIDYGGGVYTRDYFGEKRYEHFVCASLSHNLPIINGCAQSAGKEHAARDVSMGKWFIDAEYRDAYDDPGLLSFRRRISFDSETGETLIDDRFSFTQPCVSLTERFVSYGSFEPSEGAVTVIGERASCVISCDSALSCALSENTPPYTTKPRTVRICDLSPEPGKTEYRLKFRIV